MPVSSDQLQQLLDNATPGPWTFNNTTDSRGHKGEFRAESPHNGFALVSRFIRSDDMALAALAPALAAEVLQLRAREVEIRRWFATKPWEGDADGSSFGCGPYTRGEIADGYGTYRDPRFLPAALHPTQEQM